MRLYKLWNCVLFAVLLSISTYSIASNTVDIRPNKWAECAQSIPSQVQIAYPQNDVSTLLISQKPDEIRAMLQTIINGKRATGIAVGWVTPQGRCVLTVGSSGKSVRPQIDADTMFELGSITKAFTGTLLADMVAKGELKLSEPIGPYLPKSAQGNAALAAITFQQLTTHSSGLSRLPMTSAFIKSGLANPGDPYAAYSESEFIADLANLKPDADTKYAYSNTGGALLGMLLANRASKRYSELVQERLLDPIGMSATSLVSAKKDDALAAQPHDTKLRPTVGWNLGVFLPTGGARSSVNDMMKLIDANLQRKAPWVYTHEQLKPLGKVGGISYNWHFARLLANSENGEKRDTLIWHNGGTYGSTSFVGFDVARGIGVVVLVNTGALGLADEIGMHLWDQRNPPPTATPEKKSLGILLTTVAVAMLVALATLATRGYATQVSTSTTTTKRDHSMNAEQSVAKHWPKPLRNALFKPFVDRTDILMRIVYAASATSFVAYVLPDVSLLGALSLTHLLYATLIVGALFALWSSRKCGWWISGGVKRWISIAFQVAFSALFFWIAFA
jgi:CubicO group peptidase (beta-lactamase class C family)